MSSARRLLWLAFLAPTSIPLGSDEARAGEGTFSVIEAQVGTHLPAYEGAASGLSIGLSFGATLKPKRSPVRWYLLANLQTQHTSVYFESPLLTRTDLSAFLSQRTVVPVGSGLRVYFETGLGTRYGIRSSELFGSGDGFDPLLVLALGGQMRWSRSFSTGVRVAYEPLTGATTPFDGGLNAGPRGSAVLTVGVHF